MKIQINLLSHSMAVDEYMKDAQDAAEWMQKQLHSMFDKSYTFRAQVPLRAGILSNSLYVDVFNVPEGSSDLDRLNCKMRLKFIMHLTNNSGKQVDMDAFEFENLRMPMDYKINGIKYRKIVEATPRKAVEKLLAWFKKNEVSIKKYGSSE